MDRLVFLPFTNVVIAVSSFLEFSYLSFGILSGFALALFSLFWKKEDRPYEFGLIALFVAATALIAASFFSIAHGLSFEALSHARNFSKVVRGLPHIAVSFASGGLFMCAYAYYKAKRPNL